jgi:hypothetical protein
VDGFCTDDYGGPYRSSIVAMCEELQSLLLPLFVPVPNARARVGVNREQWVPRRSATRPLDIAMFEFLGQLMGASLRSRVLLDLDFPAIVWKQLVQQTITTDDVLAIDILSFNIIDHVQALIQRADITDEMMEALDVRFVAVDSEEKEVPLCVDGANTLVTVATVPKFIELLRRFRMTEFFVPVEAMRRGLATVLPFSLLTLLSWDELQVQVCGRPKFDVDLLQRQTTYDDCSASDPHVILFWRCMRERFNDVERAKWLKFVWGQSRCVLWLWASQVGEPVVVLLPFAHGEDQLKWDD